LFFIFEENQRHYENFSFFFQYITNEGSLFTFKTNLKSPNYKLINIDFSKFEMVSILACE
jgi:hypothetical protein